jgi:hypothetical protein
MNRKLFLSILTLSLFLVLFSTDRHSANAQSGEICLADDGNGASLSFNSTTGAYTFCHASKRLTGTGSVRRSGSNITLEDSGPDRKVIARVNTSVKNASASVQSPVGKTLGTISDSDTSNNNCGCR